MCLKWLAKILPTWYNLVINRMLQLHMYYMYFQEYKFGGTFFRNLFGIFLFLSDYFAHIQSNLDIRNLDIRKICDIRNFCRLPIFYYIASLNIRNFLKKSSTDIRNFLAKFSFFKFFWQNFLFLAKFPNLHGH